MGDTAFRQEYLYSFASVEGLVYPNLPGCAVAGPPLHLKKRGGGMDFGFRNPFAAVWGGVDYDGVLWLTHEHYCRQKPLSYHAQQLPRDVLWYCDPHGPAERMELHQAGFVVNPGIAPIRAGISAVQARIQNGTLKIIAGACPNLLAEAGFYAYDPARNTGSENPIDKYDHALDALRFLITRLDERRQARPAAPDSPPREEKTADPPAPRKPKAWLRYDNEELWTSL